MTLNRRKGLVNLDYDLDLFYVTLELMILRFRELNHIVDNKVRSLISVWKLNGVRIA
jgi:hypothetical protein